MSTKYELTFEVRYPDLDNFGHDIVTKKDTISLGIFDTYEDACKVGNDFLDNTISKYYKRPHYDKLMRFGDMQINLATNAGMSDCIDKYFVRIREIRIGNPIELIMDAKNAVERVEDYKKKFDK